MLQRLPPFSTSSSKTMDVNANLTSFQIDGQEDFITEVDTKVAILQSIICLTVLPFGLFLIYGIVLYEHFGVDAQKRSILNQLMSAIFVDMGLNGLLVVLTITLRCWTGPLGSTFAFVVSGSRRFFLTFYKLLGLEILLYKNLCILKPQFIMRFNDNFWTNFILVWNGIVAVLSSNAELALTKVGHPQMFLFLSGEDDLNNSTKIQTLYLVLLSLIMILLVLYMIIRLITNPGEEQSHGQGQFFNNLMHNPALINNLQILIVAFVCIVVALPGTFIVKKTPNAFVLSIIPGVLNLFLFMPILFYAFNDRLRKFAWRELKERFELSTISTFN